MPHSGERVCVRFIYRNPVSKHVLYTWCTHSAWLPAVQHIHTSDVLLILDPGSSAVHSDLLNIEFSYSFPRTHGGRVIMQQVFTMGCNRTWAHVSTNVFFKWGRSGWWLNNCHSDGYGHSLSPNSFWTLLSIGCFYDNTKTYAAHTSTVTDWSQTNRCFYFFTCEIGFWTVRSPTKIIDVFEKTAEV